MSNRELAEWMAYSTLEPFGPLREDYRSGRICATIANVGGVKKTMSPDDFFPNPIKRMGKRKSKVEDQKNYFKSLADQ